MVNSPVLDKGYLFQEARVSTLKNYLQDLASQGLYDDLRVIFARFLNDPSLSRAGALVSGYRDFNLFAVRLYASFDRGIAVQLAQLAEALYSRSVALCDEQRESLYLDIQAYWVWLSKLENAEIFPPDFQIVLCSEFPEILGEMVLDSSDTLILDPQRPLRAALWLKTMTHAEKQLALAQVSQDSFASALVRSGCIDLMAMQSSRNPVLAEAYLRHCML